MGRNNSLIMKKFICENLEELKEFYNEPEEGERVSPEEQDAMYQAGKAGFEEHDHEFGVQEELLEYFLELITDTINYTDLDRASVENIFKKAMDIAYQEG